MTRYICLMRNSAKSRIRFRICTSHHATSVITACRHGRQDKSARTATSFSDKFMPSSVSTRVPKFQPFTPSGGGMTSNFSWDGICTRSLRRRTGSFRRFFRSALRFARRLARSCALFCVARGAMVRLFAHTSCHTLGSAGMGALSLQVVKPLLLSQPLQLGWRRRDESTFGTRAFHRHEQITVLVGA